MSKPVRKMDRRTVYTLTVIKDAFIALIKQKSYEDITVVQVCRAADITRSTFYLHYDNLSGVLNAVLDDALMFSGRQVGMVSDSAPTAIDELKGNESQLAACQRVADSDKYHDLLMDPALSEYIIGRILTHEHDRMVPAIQKRTGLSRADAETIFVYTVHGSFAINRQNKFIKNEAWYHDLQLLNQFSNGGFSGFKS